MTNGFLTHAPIVAEALTNSLIFSTSQGIHFSGDMTSKIISVRHRLVTINLMLSGSTKSKHGYRETLKSVQPNLKSL